ncbi:hypothetical protein [Veronia pacifica]|uniref:AAA+ ATPase domain-containing protein n=1 Tax=Veronia pacifica TaxID=1080227 RepID=A0A1C3EJ41_9GAMM|nr:hypothetical protein [Veronia pacifica]ODA33239.1 hypothetical protein A8L45_10550 [Veronia pacifica]
MAQSPELAGGDGFTYEGNVAAFYLSALLAEAYAPGIEGRIVTQISAQQRDFGEPLDDIIVDFEDAEKNIARLSLQVKRSLIISKAKTNKDFCDIIRDSWFTLRKPDFRINVDRYGAATGTISPKKERSLKTLCDWARESVTTDHFEARFKRNASKDITEVRSDIATLLEQAKGSGCTNEEVHQFLAHFVLIKFDFLSEGAADRPIAINHIKDSIVPDDAEKAPLVWSKLVQVARESAGKAGEVNRARLVRLISPIVRLRGAPSFHQDLERLSELARSYSSYIQDDIGGERLERPEILETLSNKLSSSRVVQICGLPGSGKSVMVKRAVQRALTDGPVLFLKAEQLEGTSWNSYATSQGLKVVNLESLLVEIGATGTSILFVDAIDRVDKQHQGIILDLFRVIVASPWLDDWRIVVSLRDTGIELLRNWLGEFLNTLKVETLGLEQLNDKEAEELASANPHMRSLLFGDPQVRKIVRRPFFAKVLSQGYVAEPSAPAFAPQSEIDLVEHWWRRGGYNEIGQNVIERQQTLLNLATARTRTLNQPIRLRVLTSVAHIENLKSDGILQSVREGISVQFAHDIFFEWAFLQVLVDSGSQWVDEIRACGEPPVVARTVQLFSQWEYIQRDEWHNYLAQAEDPNLRSQWLRAWLLGPFGTARFEAEEEQFTAVVFANDFRLLQKALVWFQAEKTAPNMLILARELPLEERQRFADLLGWPSDYAEWHRFIGFILRNISTIPQRLYPEIVAVFEVWQNALSRTSNTISRALLRQCSIWLIAIEEINAADGPDANSEFWKEVPNLGDFRKSLSQLLLKASNAEPNFAEDYIRRLIDSKCIRESEFRDIISCSPVLAQSLPHLVVELSLTYLCEELPDDRVAREQQEREDRSERRKAVLAKPKEERTRSEEAFLSHSYILSDIRQFSYHDWELLSIQDDYRTFGPPSPLREPFNSLFQSSPNEALQLLKKLCNHAMESWRQLHRYSRGPGDTPIPLELTFPWGNQKFWGTDKEYLWFRSMCAPKVIGCGYMALEKWCFAQLEHGRPVDGMIKQIVEGNESIAILGIASMLANYTETVSETTLPLITSQRLLAADRNRMKQDLPPSSDLIGFTNPNDKPDVEAIQEANGRSVRRSELSRLVPHFIFAEGQISENARLAILGFQNQLPFQYEEDRDLPEAHEYLSKQAAEYMELADRKNYQTCSTREDTDKIVIAHISPSAAEPQNVHRREKATKFLILLNLWAWACKYFDEGEIGDQFTVEEAVTRAKEAETQDLFECLKGQDEDWLAADKHRAAVSAIAALRLCIRDGASSEDFEWARAVLMRAIELPEVPKMWPHRSKAPLHPIIYVARGIAADLLNDTACRSAEGRLLGLIAYPDPAVSLVALEEACKLYTTKPSLTWAALKLVFSLCHIPPRPHAENRSYREAFYSPSEAREQVTLALQSLDGEWGDLPLPPPAWVKVEAEKCARRYQRYVDYDSVDMLDKSEEWIEPDVFWYSEFAADALNRIPFDVLLNSPGRTLLLNFLSGLLQWTVQKKSPPWVKRGEQHRLDNDNYEFTRSLCSVLGAVAGFISLSELRSCFLEPILQLEDEECWEFLAPFAETYICRYLYDVNLVPEDAVDVIELCLERFLQDKSFKRGDYRSGEFFGLHKPKLIDIFMFISVEHASGAARYVNGDWSEIERIMPIVDRFIKVGGWAAPIISPFLTLCERSKECYPAEAFADQIVETLSGDPTSLIGWHGTFIPARIAGMVQHLAHREAPMELSLARKFLHILDILVDMGDRRSAALQLGEAFRSVRLTN